MKPGCPSLDSMRDALLSVQQVQKNLSTLRRQLRRCQGKDCPVLAKFNQMVDQALREVGREWGIPE